LSGEQSPGDASNSPNGDILSGKSSCSSCGANLLEDILEESVSGLASRAQRAMCDQMICKSCIAQIGRNNQLNRSLSVDYDESSVAVTPIPDSNAIQIIESMSTKIKALVADLYKHNATEKRHESAIFLN